MIMGRSGRHVYTDCCFSKRVGLVQGGHHVIERYFSRHDIAERCTFGMTQQTDSITILETCCIL